MNGEKREELTWEEGRGELCILCSPRLRSMCRHLYDPLRKERCNENPPKWLAQLRAEQQAGAGDDSDASAMKRRPSGCSDGGKMIGEGKYGWDPSGQVAWRQLPGQKVADTTTDVFPKANATPTDKMLAKFSDGTVVELDTLTVAAWSGSDSAATQAKSRGQNILWDKTDGNGIRFTVQKHQLNANNPGLKLTVDGKQKLQLAFKHWGEDNAITKAKQWALKLYNGSTTIEHCRAEKHSKEEAMGWTKGQCAKRRPAAKSTDAAGGTEGGAGKKKTEAEETAAREEDEDEAEEEPEKAAQEEEAEEAEEEEEEHEDDEEEEEEEEEEEDEEEEADETVVKRPARKRPAATQPGHPKRMKKRMAPPQIPGPPAGSLMSMHEFIYPLQRA
eukprot:9504164-Pyramimonas_sp.AAC.2